MGREHPGVDPHRWVKVRVDFNEFTQLWQVHGRKTTYWLEEDMARRRQRELQARFDRERDERKAKPK